MSALGITKRLAKGRPTKLNDSPITTVGTLDFTAPSGTNEGKDFSMLFEFVGSATSLTAALQVALDGVNFIDYVAAANFFNGVAGPAVVKVKPGLGGAAFRINVTVATGVNGSLYVCSN